MYGSGYGSTYGSGYGSSMYGGSGMYGSSMMNGMGINSLANNQNGGQGQNEQERRFRDEFQGIIIGFNSLHSIVGAGFQLIAFSGPVVELFKKAIKFAFEKCQNIAYRFLLIEQLKRFFNWVTNASLQNAFSDARTAFSAAAPKQSTSKFIIALRFIAGLVCLAALLQKNILDRNIKKKNQRQMEQELEQKQQHSINLDQSNFFDDQSVSIFEECSGRNNEADKLQEGFDAVIEKEKTFIKNTQMRSQEFWSHSRLHRQSRRMSQNSLFSVNSNSTIAPPQQLGDALINLGDDNNEDHSEQLNL